MTEHIPTMPCPSCGGTGRGDYWSDDDCDDCDGTGRIPRPPLTAAEVAALPDGARWIGLAETEYGDVWARGVIGHTGYPARERASLAQPDCRVWLAEEEADG